MTSSRYRHYESEILMTGAVSAHRFMLAAIASGTVMMLVALIILFDFAWARVRQRPYLMPVAYAFLRMPHRSCIVTGPGIPFPWILVFHRTYHAGGLFARAPCDLAPVRGRRRTEKYC